MTNILLYQCAIFHPPRALVHPLTYSLHFWSNLYYASYNYQIKLLPHIEMFSCAEWVNLCSCLTPIILFFIVIKLCRKTGNVPQTNNAKRLNKANAPSTRKHAAFRKCWSRVIGPYFGLNKPGYGTSPMTPCSQRHSG